MATPESVAGEKRSRFLVLLDRQPRQGFDGVGLFLGVDVGVELHGETDIGVPSQHLGGLGYDVGVAQIRDKRMTQGMEVGEFVVGILIFQKITGLPCGR